MKYVVHRELEYSAKNASKRNKLSIHIGEPYLLEKDQVNFNFDAGAAGCSIIIEGSDISIKEVAYGADLLQALQLAVNIDPILVNLSKKYDLFFASGEPYFE